MAVEKAYFVTAEYIKETVSINENADDNKLLKLLLTCQNIYIEPILGTDLFDAIVSKIIAGTLTGNYKTLVNDKIAPCLAYFVFYEFIVENSYSVARGGVFKNTASNSQTANTDELTFLSQRQLDRAEHYMERLSDYLCNNSELFPEYSSNSDDDIRPIHSKSFHGIGLDIVTPNDYEKLSKGERY